ncbi:unnamed protein product (mitochondrion) [Arabidopsis thaliana]|uniref:(thale cress) hypothetical protein n=1 Tax=Arabidopsis thaliana TaxID=3702 RepID=A0A7G2FJU7_ARATH|nr:unnamed protein product [Arabidopsis thaliana]
MPKPAAPLTKKRGGRSSYMDPFLSVVASAFPGRAGIFDYYSNGQAKPAGCYPNRPAGGTRRGSGNHSTAVEKSVLPSDNTHRRLSSAFFVFDAKERKSLDLRKPFLTPPHLPPFVEPFRGCSFLSELGGHSFQPGDGFCLNIGSNIILRNFSYPRQLTTRTPPHTTSWGGCSPFESNKGDERATSFNLGNSRKLEKVAFGSVRQ